jgi:hypothetical protein
VRGAIRVLEEIGFLDRAVASGSRYKATEDGLHRKPVLFMFGSDYVFGGGTLLGPSALGD